MKKETLDDVLERYRAICEEEKKRNYQSSGDGETELFSEKVEKYQRNTNRDDDDPR